MIGSCVTQGQCAGVQERGGVSHAGGRADQLEGIGFSGRGQCWRGQVAGKADDLCVSCIAQDDAGAGGDGAVEGCPAAIYESQRA